MIQSILIDIPHVIPKIKINSDNKILLDTIYIQYMPYAKKNKISDHIFNEKCLRIVEIEILKHVNKSKSKIIFNGQEYILDTISLISGITNILHRILTTEDGYLFLHGAAVSINNKSVLLLGESNAGKSTTSMYLLKKGYQYITDDKAVININNHSIMLFDRPIHLRLGGIELLKNKYGMDLNTKKIDYFNNFRYIYYVNQKKFEIPSIEYLAILKRNDKGVNIINELSGLDAFESILKNCYCSNNMSENVVKVFKLVANIKVINIKYSELHYLENMLSKFLNGSK